MSLGGSAQLHVLFIPLDTLGCLYLVMVPNPLIFFFFPTPPFFVPDIPMFDIHALSIGLPTEETADRMTSELLELHEFKCRNETFMSYTML